MLALVVSDHHAVKSALAFAKAVGLGQAIKREDCFLWLYMSFPLLADACQGLVARALLAA